MASLLGHALGGGAAMGLAARIGPAALTAKRAIWLSAAVAVLPDLDVPLSIVFGQSAALAHRGPSHSLLVIGLLAAAAAVAAIWGALKPEENPAWGWFRAFLVFAFVGASHLALDWLMGRGPTVLGVQVMGPRELAPLWPFSDATLANSPIQLIPTALYSTGSWESYFGVLKEWQTWVGMLLEVIILVPALLLAWGKAPASIRWPMAGLSAAGMLVTWILYHRNGRL
ncbi:MAG TPA: metal-dependent hydrolase [Planctomycetota bacterium]|nr:metal-dependent hydrolase [Planctomycetota bacterium]